MLTTTFSKEAMQALGVSTNENVHRIMEVYVSGAMADDEAVGVERTIAGNAELQALEKEFRARLELLELCSQYREQLGVTSLDEFRTLLASFIDGSLDATDHDRSVAVGTIIGDNEALRDFILSDSFKMLLRLDNPAPSPAREPGSFLQR